MANKRICKCGFQIPKYKHTCCYCRFWSKVSKGRDGECWNWVGTKNQDGYGRFRWYPVSRVESAHRLSWMIEHGEYPGDMQVLHGCDNPACVNPGHLFLGSASDNMKDAFKKKRKSNVGSKNPRAKLTERCVVLMRKLHAQKVSVKTLAKAFGVSHDSAYMAVSGRKWKHV